MRRRLENSMLVHDQSQSAIIVPQVVRRGGDSNITKWSVKSTVDGSIALSVFLYLRKSVNTRSLKLGAVVTLVFTMSLASSLARADDATREQRNAPAPEGDAAPPA